MNDSSFVYSCSAGRCPRAPHSTGSICCSRRAAAATARRIRGERTPRGFVPQLDLNCNLSQMYAYANSTPSNAMRASDQTSKPPVSREPPAANSCCSCNHRMSNGNGRVAARVADLFQLGRRLLTAWYSPRSSAHKEQTPRVGVVSRGAALARCSKRASYLPESRRMWYVRPLAAVKRAQRSDVPLLLATPALEGDGGAWGAGAATTTYSIPATSV